MLLGSVAIFPPCPLSDADSSITKIRSAFFLLSMQVLSFLMFSLPEGDTSASSAWTTPGRARIPVMAMTANAERIRRRGGAVKLFILVPFLPVFYPTVFDNHKAISNAVPTTANDPMIMVARMSTYCMGFSI